MSSTITSVSHIQEMDPTLKRALGYFLSKSPDSTQKLREMLAEVIAQNQKRNDMKNIVEIKNAPNLKIKAKQTANIMEQKKKEREMLSHKREFDKIKKDLEDLGSPSSLKKPKIDSSEDSQDSKSSVDTKNLDNKEFDLDLDEPPCAVCNQNGTDEKGNKAVECQECHNFFHQDCHEPAISDQDATDPRCVWYCMRCTKAMKKMAKQSSSKQSGSKDSIEKGSSVDMKSKVSSITPFKRHEVKQSLSSSGNGNGGSLSGWAALSGKPINSASGKNQNAMKKEMKNKNQKQAAKGGPKLAVSDAWAEALGAKVPAGSKSPGAKNWPSSGSGKSSGKHSSSSSKSSMFPKAAATSLPLIGKSKDEGASKRLQMVKKKVANKLQIKKNQM